MKPRNTLIIAALIMLFSSCGKSPSGSENTAPVLAGIENQTLAAGQSKDVTLSATDADGDSLSFSILNNTGFLSITDFSQAGNTATATLVIAPEESIIGTFNSTVRVIDGMGGSDEVDFTIEVSEPITRIVFKSYRSDNWDIWLMNSDGTNQSQLTDDIADDSNPAFSPDGTRIAFVSERSGNDDIWIMNADGSNPTQLTTSSEDEDNPAFSPDGNKIVFESYRASNSDIWIMNADGSNQIQLTTGSSNEWFPAFSPDGNKIAFTSTRTGEGDIYLMNVDGSDQTRLTTKSDYGEWDPDFTPDGTKISFTSVSSTLWMYINIINVDGSNEVRLTDSGNDMNPSFSPSGNSIAFASTSSGNYDIWVMSANGEDLKRLTSDPERDMAPDWHE